MTHKISLPSNTVIIYGLALADALTIGYGLVSLDSISTDYLTRFFIVGRGLFVGGFGGLALAMTANKLPLLGVKKFAQKVAGWSAFGVVLAVTMAIIAPVTYANMNPLIVASVHDGVRVIISLAAGLLVPALTAAVAFTSGKLESETQPETTGAQPDTTKKQPTAKQEQPTRRELSDVALAEELKRNPNATQAQLGITFGVSAAAIGKRLRKMKGK